MADPRPTTRETADAGTAVLAEQLDSLRQAIQNLDRLTGERFVTHKTMLDANADRVALALASADQAVTKAEVATNKRFDAVNAFRQQLADQTRTFVTREVMDAQISPLNKAIDELARWKERQDGKGTGQAPIWAMVSALVTAVLVYAVVGLISR